MDAAGEERIEVSSPTCVMPPLEGRVPRELVEKALKPLWACWRALFAARQKRDPLELDLPERRVMLDEKGRIASIAPRDRLDAHRLVEDYMIAANVAAARALEAKKAPVMYRVHEAAEPRETGRAQGLSEDLRNRVHARPGDQARHLQPDHRARRRRRRPRRDHGAIAPHPDAGALLARAARPFRAGARDLRPFHLADPALRRPARPPLAGRAPTSSARAGCRAARTRSSSRSASKSRCSSGARWRPSARPSTAMSRPFSSDQVGQLVECRITGVQPFGFFATVEDLGGDGLVFAQRPRPRIFPLRRGGAAAGRRARPARPTGSASG